jgi:hypothetical protein
MSRQVMSASEFNQMTTREGYDWVRLTNKEETHHGYTYQTGLNVDIKPFRVDTDCNDGLFFCIKKDSLYWCDDKLYTRKVTIPDSLTDMVVVDFAEGKAKAHRFVLGDRTDLLTDDFCKLAVQQNGYLLEYVPPEKRSDEMCKLAVQQNGHAFEYVPLEKRSDEIYKLAVQENGYALQYFPLEKCSDEINKLAVQQNGHALQHVPLEKRSDEICQLAMQQNGDAIAWFPLEKRCDFMCKLSLSQSGSCLV